MISRSLSIGALLVSLMLSACGGGGGESPDSGSQSTTTGDTNTGTATPATTGTLSLRWAAPAERSNGDSLSLSEISSYTIYFGTEAGNYPYSVAIDDPSSTSVDIPDLPAGTYYLVITATDSQGLESGHSNIAVREIT